MISPISLNNPIQRLTVIETREMELGQLLAPVYAAVALLHHELDDRYENVDVTILEVHPKWAPLWKELNQLRDEKMKIHMDLAIAWEMTARF